MAAAEVLSDRLTLTDDVYEPGVGLKVGVAVVAGRALPGNNGSVPSNETSKPS